MTKHVQLVELLRENTFCIFWKQYLNSEMGVKNCSILVQKN